MTDPGVVYYLCPDCNLVAHDAGDHYRLLCVPPPPEELVALQLSGRLSVEPCAACMIARSAGRMEGGHTTDSTGRYIDKDAHA